MSCNKHTAKGVNSDIKLPDYWQPMDQNHPVGTLNLQLQFLVVFFSEAAIVKRKCSFILLLQGYIKVQVDPTSEEYKKISDKFHMVEYAKQVQQPVFAFGTGGDGNQYPGPGIQIRSIYRVQNPKLWKIYSL